MNAREKLIDIRNHFYHAQDSLDAGISLLEELCDNLDGFNLSATREGDRIRIEWTGSVGEIQWFLDGDIVSLNKMWETTNFNPAPIEEPPYYIGQSGTVDLITEVRVGTGEWDKDKGKFVFDESENVPVTQEPHIEPVKLPEYVGLWDSHNAPEEVQKIFNMGLSLSPNKSETQPVLDLYGKVIPVAGGFKKVIEENVDVENRLRQVVRNKVSFFEEIGWENILWVNLEDEPKYDVKWQEIIVDEARKAYKVPAGFTYTAGAINKKKFPNNIEIVPFNGYPFFQKEAEEGHEQIWTKQEFMDYYDNKVEIIREKIPGARLGFTAQCFSNTDKVKWRKPPSESPKWYLEVAAKYDATLLLYQYKSVDSHGWKCLDRYPDLLQAWKDALK